MRVPLIKPADLTEQQTPLYEDMKQGIAANFQGFTNTGTDSALLGPWNPWLHELGVRQRAKAGRLPRAPGSPLAICYRGPRSRLQRHPLNGRWSARRC